jgi:beta-glucosidase
MKTIALVLVGIICVEIFCIRVQQTSAFPLPATGPAIADVPDSDEFLRSAGRSHKPPRDNSSRVAELLARMTIEEKVGQMTQLAIGFISNGNGDDIQLNQAKLEKAVVKYGTGSILNVKDQALTVAKWRELIGQLQAASQKTRLKIPILYGIDSIHGGN